MTATYLNDVSVPGKRALGVWQDTLESIHWLIAAGFPLNVDKLQLMVACLNVLGFILFGNRY